MKFLIVLIALFCVAAGLSDTSTSTSSNGFTTTQEPISSSTSVNKQTTTADETTAVVTTSSSSTTHSPSTTTGSSSTTPSPTTSPIPNNWESTNTYNYTKNGTVCLLAKFAAHFKKDNKIWNVTKDAEMTDTTGCGKLSVKFDGNKFELVFNQTSKGAFYLQRVNAALVNGTQEINAFKTGLALAKASNGSSYMCLSGFPVSLSENVTMYLKEVQFQAYYVKGATFATAYECTGDFPDNMLVPIIVGCALGGLIVVVLLAYCVLRSRANRKYDPVDNTI
uniref:lysosome-associated membrane glycoprotein 2-like isoform X1 n=1 Tax=Styela clava TaxID=7725 RepID=UPI00193A7BDB|nr:lysosome-associated membrane glycoprotein 2-like isoform X1 [Styela clava]